MKEVASAGSVTERPVVLAVNDIALNGDLSLPPDARGLVIFAHGSGSSRHSIRNRAVAEVLHQSRFATLVLDLLTEHEERTDVVTAEFRFDIPLLAERVVAAVDWAGAHEPTTAFPLGLFGASTGAAAALIAAAKRQKAVRAVVSSGGRPDLADGALPGITAPTLLIVGGRDDVVIRLNRQALERLNAPKELEIVPGASHLFEEPGTLEHVSHLAGQWFAHYL